MSRLKFDHVGVVVQEITEGREFLRATLGIEEWTEIFADPGIGVYVQFGRAPGDGPCYEVIAPLGEDSPVMGAVKTGKNVLNHVAYLTEDLGLEGERLRQRGCVPTAAAQPAVAYGGRRVQFWITPLRFMVELVEAPGHAHVYDAAEV